MKISAVLITNGNVDLQPVLDTLINFEDVVVYDKREVARDLRMYGRFTSMLGAKHDVIYTQDDDVLTDPAKICAEYKPGWVTTNVPPERRAFYSDGVTLIGWGSVFDRSLVAAFDKYFEHYPMDDLFLREADRVFTGLNRCRNIDVPIRHLGYAYAMNRMGQQTNHLASLAAIRQRIYAIR